MTRSPSVVIVKALMTSECPNKRSKRMLLGDDKQVPEGTRTGTEERLH